MKFDGKFYLNMYPDVLKAGYTEKTVYRHYIKYGKKEGRISCESELKQLQKKGIIDILLNYKKYVVQKKEQQLINILIRTSNRPESFKKCISSILEQEYINYNVIICYDKPESLEYLDNYRENENITYFPIHIESEEKYKFNLYCNELLNKVKKGYVIFLDDDDMFCHNRVFNILNYCINNETLLIWKFFRPDKIIYPSSLKEIILGEIASCSFCSNIKNYKNCKWWNKKNGDYNFFTKVVNKNKPKIVLLNKILTKTQFRDRIGNLGK